MPPPSRYYVAERVPRVLAQLRLVEAQRRKLGEKQVAIDALVLRQRRLGEGVQLRLPAVREGEAGSPAYGTQVGPFAVDGVHAHGGRSHRKQVEELVQEDVYASAELRHSSPRL